MKNLKAYVFKVRDCGCRVRWDNQEVIMVKKNENCSAPDKEPYLRSKIEYSLKHKLISIDVVETLKWRKVLNAKAKIQKG